MEPTDIPIDKISIFVDKKKHYSTQILLPFESEELKMQWFHWYMNEGQKSFFEWAKIKGIALAEIRK